MAQTFSQAQTCNLICNGDFESPAISSTPSFYSSSLLSCWQTTASDSAMELCQAGYGGVSGYSGNQFLEMNAFFVSTIFQNFNVNPATTLAISFAHKGRAGIDTVGVQFGPVGGPYIDLGLFADSMTTWGYYTVFCTVPNSGTFYSLRFNSIYASWNNPGIGNFLDDVEVCISSLETSENEITNGIDIYPNPAHDAFYINTLGLQDLEIEIISMSGQKKAAYHSSGEDRVLISEKLAKGIYIAKIYNKSFSSNHKLIIH